MESIISEILSHKRFFPKFSKFNVDSQYAIKTQQFLVCQILAFELARVNVLYYYENTCSRQSMCWILCNTEFFLFLSTILINFCGALLHSLHIVWTKISISYIRKIILQLKAFSSANLLNNVLKILKVTFEAIFT